VHGTQIAGQTAKCSWGKENPNGMGSGPSMANAGGMPVTSYGMGPGMGGEGVPQDQMQYYQQQQQYYYAQMYNQQQQQYMQYYPQQYGGGYGYPQQAPPPPPNH
jgi:hypothetical protein